MQPTTMRLLTVATTVMLLSLVTVVGVGAQNSTDPEPTALRVRITTEPEQVEGTFALDFLTGRLSSDYAPDSGPGAISVEANTWHDLGTHFEGDYGLVLQSLPPDFEARAADCRSKWGSRPAYDTDDHRALDLELSDGDDWVDCEFEVEYVDPAIGPRGHVAAWVTGPATSRSVARISILTGELPADYVRGAGSQGTEVTPFTPAEEHYLLPGPTTIVIEELEPEWTVEGVSCVDRTANESWASLEHDESSPYGQQAATFEVMPGRSVICEFALEEVVEPPELGAGSGAATSTTETNAEDPAAPAPSADPEPPEEPLPDPVDEPVDDDPADEVFAPRPGLWRSAVTSSATGCGNKAVPLPNRVDSGPIRVKNGGRRIVIVAEQRIVLDQVEDQPGLYRGTLNERSTGRVVPLKYQFTVIDPEHMEGKLRANFRAEGKKCWIRETWDSRYIGE